MWPWVYRVGVGADDREAVETSLLAELGDPAEASCIWSNPGDTYVLVVRYTGAIRLDLKPDPEDSRFQAFAVGYGTSAEAAEEDATAGDARFATYADRSGYEVLPWRLGPLPRRAAVSVLGDREPPRQVPGDSPQGSA